ncbi:hypothetical protein KI387_037877, partial [Taxus chinensis]
RQSGPVKEWKESATEIENIGEEYVAIESMCSLLQPLSLIPASPHLPFRS